MDCDICLTESFQADRYPRERGYRPLNSRRWRGASRRPNGRELNERPVSGAAPANRAFKLSVACSRRTRTCARDQAPQLNSRPLGGQRHEQM